MRYTVFILSYLVTFLFQDKVAAQSMHRYTIENGDTIPVVDLAVCHIGKYSEPPRDLSKKQLTKYLWLARKVKKVYPYAQLAATKLKEYETELAAVQSDKERRKIMKKVENAIKEQYGDELKKLSVSQGKILLKLIDRETGRTSYDLVKDMRGSFSVACWQGVARIFGHNLKSEYDAQGDDAMIEHIIKRIELGTL